MPGCVGCVKMKLKKRKLFIIIFIILFLLGLFVNFYFCRCDLALGTPVLRDDCSFSITNFFSSVYNILFFPSSKYLTYLSIIQFPEGSWFFGHLEVCEGFDYIGPKYFPVLFWLVTILYWFLISYILSFIYLKLIKLFRNKLK